MMLLTATMPPVTPNAAVPAPRTDNASSGSRPSGTAENADKSSVFSDSLAQSTARHSTLEKKPADTQAPLTRAGSKKTEPVENEEDVQSVTEQDLASQVLGWAEHMAARRDAQALKPRAQGDTAAAIDRHAITTQSILNQPVTAESLTLAAQGKTTLTALLARGDGETMNAGAIAGTEKRGAKGARLTTAAERHAAGPGRKGSELMPGLSQHSAAANETDTTDIRLAANKPIATDLIGARPSALTTTEPATGAGTNALTTTPFAQILNQTTSDIAPRTAHISVPVGHPQWGHTLGQQLVAWSQHARTGEMKAELRLDPPDMGPLRVALTITDGVASASFVSAHAAVRTALEQAMPQLHAALATSGISLGQTHVGENGTGAFGHGAQGQGSDAGGHSVASGAESSLPSGTTSTAELPARPERAGHGLLDVFA